MPLQTADVIVGRTSRSYLVGKLSGKRAAGPRFPELLDGPGVPGVLHLAFDRYAAHLAINRDLDPLQARPVSSCSLAEHALSDLGGLIGELLVEQPIKGSIDLSGRSW